MSDAAAGPVPATTGDASCDRRVVFLAATARDAVMTQAMVAPAGISLEVCRSFDAALRAVRAGAGALMLPEEATPAAQTEALRALLGAQPPWSDLPVLVLTRPGADSAESGDAVRLLGNVTLIERPVRVATLLSALRTALRARARQYDLRRHLAERVHAEESLRLADQRKDEFLATLGHELRNPLAPLLTALHLLKTSGVHDPVTQRVSAVMDRQISHLVRLVDDLLEVSRITRGLVDVRRDVLELSTVVQAAIDTSLPTIEAARHQLEVGPIAEGIHVRGDAVRLTQVFANLLTNAAKYTDAGGRLAISLAREGPRARVTVSDNGIGIAPEQLTSVFDMFTQVDRSSRRAQGGLGIGLTLVRSLVTLHNGHVEAYSEGLGRGSRFIVDLPAIDASTPGPQPAAEGADRFPDRRVLIVDDNRDAAEMLCELLQTLGATTRTAHSGAAALEAVASFAPDAVLLDLGMPGMDGFEVARRIRAAEGDSRVLLIALTGWGQDHDRDRARAAGIDHHVVKPPDIAMLRGLLAAGRPVGTA